MHQLISSETPASGNFCDLILRHAESQPWVTALSTDGDQPRAISFGELAVAITHFRRRCRNRQWQPGEPVVLMLKPTPALYISVLGLLAEGMIPVFIDRGLGSRRMLQALKLSGARRVIANDRLVKIGRLLTAIRPVRWYTEASLLPHSDVSVFGDWQWGEPIAEHAHGLISYTSGTTGRPKGADRTHTSLIAQHQAIRSHWPDQGTDVDMTCLPILVLHNLCCGMPSILPDMDFAAPASVNGHTILKQIHQHDVSRISGAPAFIKRVADAVDQLPPPSLQSVRIGGAPVGSKLARHLAHTFPDSDIAIVYGSTEAEPIAHIAAQHIAADDGVGYPVGKPVPQTSLMRIAEQAQIDSEATLKQLQVANDEPGEIVVCGPHVLRGYVNDPDATRENKIPGANGDVWHRTGDLATVDSQGNLRLLGRRSDRLEWQDRTLLPFTLERQLQDLQTIRQAALVQAAPGKPPRLFVSLEPECEDKTAAVRLCKTLLNQANLPDTEVKVMQQLPVDSRHNSKILRAPLKKRCT